MTLVQDILDRYYVLKNDRAVWDGHWLDMAKYVLPDAERFDRMFATSPAMAINSVAQEPVAARRSREIYDMTSLWAVDRGASGTQSLVMPQTSTWHDLTNSDPFGKEPSVEEEQFYQRLRDYLFRVRANPMTGFWVARKAALRCLWGFGTSVIYTGPKRRKSGLVDVAAPLSYIFVPLSENHMATDPEGVVDTNYRLFTKSARQCVKLWGNACSEKTRKMAESEKDKDKPVQIIHAIYPREERGSYGNLNRDAPFASCIIEPDEKHLVEESGDWEFPYVVDHWQKNSQGPYAEGPVALCIAEVKSLQLLSKTMLRGAQQSVDPPMLAHQNTSGMRLDLNPRAVNYGFLSESGAAWAQPVLTADVRLAETVLALKREQVETMTYARLWTTIIDSERQQTAYEVSIKNQERADMIGPVGTSLQHGLSFQIDREIGVLGRAGAFDPGSALEPPESLVGRDFGPRFTSPLDRARKIGELQGATQLVTMAFELAANGNPGALDRIDFDQYISIAAFALGAPAKMLTTEDVYGAVRQERAAANREEEALRQAAMAGAAGAAATEGVEMMKSSPTTQRVLAQLAGVAA